MSKEKLEGITKIAVSGFKSLAEECTIDICPLTLLAGANSSGKSSIMQPLLMLKQTLEAPYDPGPLLLEGPNVQFTSAEQFLSKLVDKKGTDRFQIRIETLKRDFFISVRTVFKKGPKGIEIVEMTKIEIKHELLPPKNVTLYPEMSSKEIKSLADQGLIPKGLIPQRFEAVGRSRCFLRVLNLKMVVCLLKLPMTLSSIFLTPFTSPDYEAIQSAPTN